MFAQTLRTHTIDAKDTLETIAQRYGVIPEDILVLNPDAKDHLAIGKVLVIPNPIEKNTGETTEIKELVSYKIHRVKRKETLYSIAKKYNTSVKELKKHNQQLYTTPLQFKDKIYVPKYKTKTVAVVPRAVKTYSVLPKEGKWRVAYKFGISVQELEALNPNMGTVLRVGQQLNVPNIENDEEQEVGDERYGFYEVLPKEGFYRLYKKLGIAQDVLEQLNPGLAETGLKVGMVLKVPKTSIEGIDLDALEKTQLVNQLKFLSPKSVALILPFKVNTIDFDSIKLAKQQIQRDGYIRIATEFYSGVEMALDSAQRLGISVALDVFDTEANPQTTNRLLRANDFSKYDVVLGPLSSENSNIVAQALQPTNTPVVSPFVKFNNRTDNLIQTIPNDEWMAEKLLRHAKKDTIPHNTLIISDSKSIKRAKKIQTVYPNATLLTSQRDDEGKEQFYIQFEIVQKALESGRTLVFLETNNEGFASNVTSMLNGLNGVTRQKDDVNKDIEFEIERELVLMTTNRNKAFMGNNISNTDLSNLNFQFPSVHFYKEDLNSFTKSYKQRFGAYPTRYATRGFDLTLDLLLRLAAYDSIFEQLTMIQTNYLENKFKYIQSPRGGYVNKSAYILKYDNLFIVKVED
jgi:LysM repeat protein